jgi:hypothetical protein
MTFFQPPFKAAPSSSTYPPSRKQPDNIWQGHIKAKDIDVSRLDWEAQISGEQICGNELVQSQGAHENSCHVLILIRESGSSPLE